jgi:hypothetical protein
VIVELEALQGLAECAPPSEEALRGKELLFELARQRRCAGYHEPEGLGPAVGPNFALAARAKRKRELVRDIRRPHAESTEASIKFVYRAPLDRSSYYDLNVMQDDGELDCSGPVWLGEQIRSPCSGVSEMRDQSPRGEVMSGCPKVSPLAWKPLPSTST